MTSRSVLVLVLLAVVAGLAAWMAGGSGPGPAASGVGEPLLPALVGRVNDVAALTIVTHDDRFTVRLDGDTWKLDERDGYPAKFESVKKTLLALSQMRTLEAKTSNPERHAKLGVEDPEAPEATSALVTLVDRGGQSLGAVILGNSGDQQDTLYARRASEAQSWLVRGTLWLERTPAQWIPTEALMVEGQRLRRVATEHADGETLVTERTNEEQQYLEVRDVPEGQQPKTPTIARIQGSALAPLTFEDVAAASRQALPAEDVVTTTFDTFDGLHVVVRTAPELEPAAEPAEGEEPAEPAVKRYWCTLEVSAADDATEEVKAEATAAQARVGPWTFALAEWKAANLRKRMADMVSPKEPGPATEPGQAEPPAMEATEVPPHAPHEGPHAEEAPDEVPPANPEQPKADQP